MRWCLLFLAAVAFPQDFSVIPPVINQGDTLHVVGPENAVSARMEGRTIGLFPYGKDRRLGLMPVPSDTKPAVYELQFLNAAGEALTNIQVTVRDAHFRIDNVMMGKSLTQLKPSPHEADETMAFRKLVTDVRYWTEPIQAPIDGCLTSPFGSRRFQNHRPTGAIHAGVDMRGVAGTPIHAATGGVVALVRSWNMHGNTVGLDHGQGFVSMYLHMSKTAVVEGQKVKQGDVIGYVGSTGRSTGPHLHWTLYVHSVPVNPAQWVELHHCGAP